jgi:alpha-glucosidase (family GH31 glycosyl hydrolase)
VVTEGDVAEVTLVWRDADGVHRLPLTPVDADPAAATAFAGGEGHLAEAQAGGLAAEGRQWAVTSRPVTHPAEYTFEAIGTAGETVVSPSFRVLPISARPGGTLRVHGPADRIVAEPVWEGDDEGLHLVHLVLRLEPGEHVVGFGERFDALDQRGRRLDAVVFEQYKGQAAAGRTYLPMPFAHVVPEERSATPWGFHVATTRRTWYDVGQAAEGELRVTVALGGTPDESVDLHVWTGEPAEVLRSFTGAVGTAEELPSWVFRLWASGNEWNTQAEVLERMDRHAELDIPVGAVVIEAWSDEQGFSVFNDARYDVHLDGSAHTGTDLTYPADGHWPDPAGLVKELHGRDVKVVLWQIPLQKTRADLPADVPDDAQVLVDGRVMVERGYALREADGTPYHNRGWWFPQALMPDLTSPEARTWWTEKRRYLVRDLDVDGFKTDGGEHAWGHDLRYADGTRGDESNNRFPLLYAQAFGDLLRSEGKAPVTFSRAGFTGTQAHGIVWAGDEDSTWEAFRASVTAGLTAASCGIVYWSWDLAGFSGAVPEPELYLRAAAAAAFMPVMQYHSEFNHHRSPARDRTPWWVAETHSAPYVVPAFRRFAHLRERLVDYLARSARHAIETGRPLLRPLFFDDRGASEAWAHPLQWRLGEDLLVSPVTEPGVTTWRAWLPPGSWVDAWTGEGLDGARVVERQVPLTELPVFVRARAWPDLAAVFTDLPGAEAP